MKARFFKTPAEFRKWLAKNHATEPELWVGFYRVGSGKPSITWPQSVDEALCVGWIDGLRQGIDEASYRIRFSARRKGSIWSAINIGRVTALAAEGRMLPAGLEAFEARKENKSGIYSYEQRPERLTPPYEGHLRRNKTAWTFFRAQPASYRRAATWWVISAKKEETRLKRLGKLIEDSGGGRRLPQFTRP